MSATSITPDRVLALIETYGANPGRWPEAERAAAEALIAAAPERFADAMEDARALDAALAALPERDVPDGLMARVLADAPKPISAPRRSLWGSLFEPSAKGAGRWSAATAALAAMVGVAAGYSSASAAPSADAADQALYSAVDSALGDLALDWDAAE